MKNRIIFLAVVLISCSAALANPAVNPEDSFYTYVQSWQSRGLISCVPPLRPYPICNIKDILETVIDNGTESDRTVAEDFYEEVTGRPFHAYNKASEKSTASADVKDGENEGSFEHLEEDLIGVEGVISFNEDYLSLGYDVGFVARSGNRSFENDFLPLYCPSSTDNTGDASSISKFNVNVNANSIFNAGNSNIFFQTGINRVGYGDFIGNGLAINEASFHRPEFSFTLMNDKVSYVQQFAVLSAVPVTGFDYEDTYNIENEKFFAFHALNYSPVSWISLDVYESAVYGQRFDPSYLVPAPYMACQVFSGYGTDGVNLLMGFGGKVTPVKGLVTAVDFFVDDVSFNDIAKFDFDTRILAAMNAGITYYPENSFVSLISIADTVITPYTYSHREESDTYSYQSYTNYCTNMGSSYDPDSNALDVKFVFTPLKNLSLTVNEKYIVHGNIAESWDDSSAAAVLSTTNKYSSDGSIFTSYDRTTVSVPTSLNFLTQDHKMHVLQSGIKAEYTLGKQKWGELSFNLSYTFEYIHNKGVDTDIYPSGSVTYNNSTGIYTYGGETTDDASVVVSYYKNQWISSLYDEFNNYVTIGFTYIF